MNKSITFNQYTENGENIPIDNVYISGLLNKRYWQQKQCSQFTDEIKACGLTKWKKNLLGDSDVNVIKVFIFGLNYWLHLISHLIETCIMISAWIKNVREAPHDNKQKNA